MDKEEQYFKSGLLVDDANDLYIESLQNLFDSDDFYSQPKNTKLYIKFGKDEELIGNAVIANFQETNEKIPVYSYNSPTYKKFLQGKKIVSGVIVLRKITVTNFLSLKKINSSSNEEDKQIEKYNKEIEELEKIKNIVPTDIINHLKKAIETAKLNKDVYMKKEVSNFNLINYIENFNKENFEEQTGCSIRIVFENTLDNTPSSEIKLKNVLITRKETEITVEKNDIFEVYNFIGNPED